MTVDRLVVKCMSTEHAERPAIVGRFRRQGYVWIPASQDTPEAKDSFLGKDATPLDESDINFARGMASIHVTDETGTRPSGFRPNLPRQHHELECPLCGVNLRAGAALNSILDDLALDWANAMPGTGEAIVSLGYLAAKVQSKS